MAIHLLWTITLLALALVAVLTGMASGEKINDFLSFASSLASLVLAVVAIIYSFVSTRDVSASIAELRNASKDTAGTAAELKISAQQIRDTNEKLRVEVSSIRPDVKAISDKFDARFASDAVQPLVDNDDAQFDDLTSVRSTSK